MAEVRQHPKGSLSHEDGVISFYFMPNEFGLSGGSLTTTRYVDGDEITDEITATVYVNEDDVDGPEIEVRRVPDGSITIRVTGDLPLHVIEEANPPPDGGKGNVVHLFQDKRKVRLEGGDGAAS